MESRSRHTWIQGESDSRGGTAVNDRYRDTFAKLVAAIGTTCREKTFPVILGVDEAHKFVADNPDSVLALHKQYAADHDHAIYTSMIGLEKADATHLTPAGLIEHGKVLHQAYRELNPIGKKSKKRR